MGAREQPLLAFCNQTPGNGQIEQLKLICARDHRFEVGEPDAALGDLKLRFEAGADLVIHGHTHAAKAYLLEGGFCINTGTWGQLLDLPSRKAPDETWQRFLDLLRGDEASSFRHPTLASVRYIPEQKETRAALLKWQQPDPKTLAERRFSDRRSGWRKEG